MIVLYSMLTIINELYYYIDSVLSKQFPVETENVLYSEEIIFCVSLSRNFKTFVVYALQYTKIYNILVQWCM